MDGSAKRRSERPGLAMLASTLVSVLLGAACSSGSEGERRSVAAVNSGEAAERVDALSPVPRYEGNPGDILTMWNQGVVDSLIMFSDYEQMRDYSDATVIGVLEHAWAIRQPEVVGGAALDGVLGLELSLVQQVGGREVVKTRANGHILVVVGLDATPDIKERVLQRIENLYGKARYLMFLRRGVPLAELGEETPYTVSLQAGPPGLLAFWPGDGRLTTVQGEGDLFEAAVQRGEELTGRPDEPQEPFEPDFSGSRPVGLSEAEVVAQFAVPLGSTDTEPPSGWDTYLRVAREAGVYD